MRAKPEERYAVIEKEMLAVLFSLKKFHQNTFGTKTTIHSDHKPLQSILKKSLDKAPKHLQGMISATQLYDYEVQYCKNTNIHIADTLPRAYPEQHATREDDHFDHISATEYVPIKSVRLKKANRGNKT